MLQAVSHVFTPAPSGRSRCRGCGQPIANATLRFGESLPNPFGGGEMTLWFHPLCAAYRLPKELSEGLEETSATIPERAQLIEAAQASSAHPRLARIDGAERSRSGQAACRQCHQPISKGSWRIRLVFYEEGRFAPGGYLHAGCAPVYFETDAIGGPIQHFSPTLSPADREELSAALTGDRTTPHPRS